MEEDDVVPIGLWLRRRVGKETEEYRNRLKQMNTLEQIRLHTLDLKRKRWNVERHSLEIRQVIAKKREEIRRLREEEESLWIAIAEIWNPGRPIRMKTANLSDERLRRALDVATRTFPPGIDVAAVKRPPEKTSLKNVDKKNEDDALATFVQDVENHLNTYDDDDSLMNEHHKDETAIVAPPPPASSLPQSPRRSEVVVPKSLGQAFREYLKLDPSNLRYKKYTWSTLSMGSLLHAKEMTKSSCAKSKEHRQEKRTGVLSTKRL